MLLPTQYRRVVASFSAIALMSAVAVWRAGNAQGGHDVGKTEKPDQPGVKAPIDELMHCPLAFAGLHLMKDDPAESRVAYHFCKTVHPDLNQCVLYDGTGPDARLIGIEYLVSNAIYQSMPDEEKVYWHDHKFEIDHGLLKSLTQSEKEEKETLAQVRTMWGKVYHTWVDGKTYPRGPARLFWSVTGEKPFVLPDEVSLPAELRRTAR
jgi:hypothetical protein